MHGAAQIGGVAPHDVRLADAVAPDGIAQNSSMEWARSIRPDDRARDASPLQCRSWRTIWLHSRARESSASSATCWRKYAEKEKLYPVAEPDEVQRPPRRSAAGALGILARRGHDRALIERLLGWLDGRPLESGLVAWDALTTSLYSDEESPFVKRRVAWRAR